MSEERAESTRGAWASVGLLIVAAVVLGVAFVLTSLWVAVAGAAVGVAGLAVGVKVGIMENVEE